MADFCFSAPSGQQKSARGFCANRAVSNIGCVPAPLLQVRSCRQFPGVRVPGCGSHSESIAPPRKAATMLTPPRRASIAAFKARVGSAMAVESRAVFFSSCSYHGRPLHVSAAVPEYAAQILNRAAVASRSGCRFPLRCRHCGLPEAAVARVRRQTSLTVQHLLIAPPSVGFTGCNESAECCV